jgi:hypothetical protein
MILVLLWLLGRAFGARPAFPGADPFLDIDEVDLDG